jgi:hypothetical protein
MDSVLYWIGVNDSLAEANEIPTLLKTTEGDFELMLPHNGREVESSVFSSSHNPDSLYLSYFDNGTVKRGYSRVIVYGIDRITQSHGIIFEENFPYSPFAGSVEFLPNMNGIYLVNVPYLPVPLGLIRQWAMNGNTDSLDHYLPEMGNLLYLMNLSGDTLAAYRTRNANYIYQAELFTRDEIFDLWPEVICNNINSDEYLLNISQTVDSVKWYNGEQEFLSSTADIQVPSGAYYFTFKKGITTGFSRLYHTSDCVISGVVNAEKSDIIIFPNPAKERLSFLFDPNSLNRALSLSIYNILGVEVISGEIAAESTIDIRYLPSGPYFYIFSDASKIINSGKFIKSE